MKRLLLLVLILCCATPLVAAPLIKVVAVVNNDAVTSYQLEKNLTTAMAADTSKNQLNQAEHKALKRKILDSMIEELLVEQRIREIGLKVSDDEINSAIEDVQRQNNLTREQLVQALKVQGVDFPDYKQNLRKEILRYKLVGREVRNKVEVTRSEIRKYFNAHKKEYQKPSTLRLGRISYPLDKNATTKEKDILKQKIKVLRQQLLTGKPFSEVVATLDPQAEGGDMGSMIEAEMNAKLRKTVTGLKVGEVSAPEDVLGSIHIFQVLERTPARAELTEDVRRKIEEILARQNSEERFAEWKKELRKDASIDIRL